MDDGLFVVCSRITSHPSNAGWRRKGGPRTVTPHLPIGHGLAGRCEATARLPEGEPSPSCGSADRDEDSSPTGVRAAAPVADSSAAGSAGGRRGSAWTLDVEPGSRCLEGLDPALAPASHELPADATDPTLRYWRSSRYSGPRPSQQVRMEDDLARCVARSEGGATPSATAGQAPRCAGPSAARGRSPRRRRRGRRPRLDARGAANDRPDAARAHPVERLGDVSSAPRSRPLPCQPAPWPSGG